jgi:hypothetical protein
MGGRAAVSGVARTGYAVTAALAALMLSTSPASADVTSAAQSAAAAATVQGYRTGIAVLDLQTGQYTGASEDTTPFASESVAKVLIATELLATGQMTGDTATTAYQMITQSDDDDADTLYGLAGGDDVINLVAARYHIDDLGTPPNQPGYWGNTEITAKGLVYLYAAIAKDPVVGPWLLDAMSHTTEYGADGTYQFFGIPSATSGAAVKQGWGDDGDDSPNAVFDSTGYVDQDQFAVAILTDGSPDTYGSAISDAVTAEAQTLMPGGMIDDPAKHDPVLSGTTVTASGSTVTLTGTASDPDDPHAALTVRAYEGTAQVATAHTDPTSHAFTLHLLARDGSHSYRVVVDNVGEGSAAASATVGPVSVDGDPAGSATEVTAGTDSVTVSGWETDPNAVPEQAPRLAISVDGGTPTVHTATGPPVPSVPQSAASYRVTLATSPGLHRLTVTYLHSGDGTDVTDTAWLVTVPGPDEKHPSRIGPALLSSVGVGALPLVVVAVRQRSRRRVRRHGR